MVHKMNIYGNVRHSNPIRDTGDELVEEVGRGKRGAKARQVRVYRCRQPPKVTCVVQCDSGWHVFFVPGVDCSEDL